MKKIIKLFTILFLMLSFVGCTKYNHYYTREITQENVSLEKKIPVNILVTTNRDDWGGIGKQRIEDDIKDLLAKSSLFTEDSTSEATLKIDIQHIYENNSAGLASAAFTGLTLGIIPSIIDRDSIITIQLKDIKHEYLGTRMTSTARPSMNKYSEGYSSDILKNLVKNALNEFNVKYFRAHVKN